VSPLRAVAPWQLDPYPVVHTHVVSAHSLEDAPPSDGVQPGETCLRSREQAPQGSATEPTGSPPAGRRGPASKGIAGSGRTTVWESERKCSMSCTKCGYALGPFETNCPRCAKAPPSAPKNERPGPVSATAPAEKTAERQACKLVEPPNKEPVRVSPKAKLWPRWKCECGGWVLWDSSDKSAFGLLTFVMGVACAGIWREFFGGSVQAAILLVAASWLFGIAVVHFDTPPPYLCTSCGRRAKRPSGQAYLPE